MLAEILRFELRHQLQQPVFLLAGAFFFLSAFLAVTTDAVVIGGSIGTVDRNAPLVILGRSTSAAGTTSATRPGPDGRVAPER